MFIKNENCTEFVDNMSERIWRGERQQEAVWEGRGRDI